MAQTANEVEEIYTTESKIKNFQNAECTSKIPKLQVKKQTNLQF